MLRNTTVANLFDLCSISLPMPGTPRHAGFMLTARGDQDGRLLSIAAAVEGQLGLASSGQSAS
jgi:aspartyl-tRNA(Asn)/glutamyl-tRNA(Gln) amidotransferase subunit A